MYESNNKNNRLTNKALESALTRVEKLVSEGSCRFEAGITDTPELGKVSSLAQIFKNAVLAVCRAEKIEIDEKALEAKIEPTRNGLLFGGISVGGYERANFKRNLYAHDFAEVFRTAMGPEIREQMIAPLRAVLVQDAPVVAAKSPALVVV